MPRHAPLIALASLALAAAGLFSLALSPARHGARGLSLAAVVTAPFKSAAVAAGLAEPPKPWDDSPAALGLRTKTTGCTVGGPYPDPACTPGAIFATTTVKQMCVSGYTKTVRNVSAKLKRQVYAEYNVAYPQPAGTYEADHVIPLELGGSNDIANLFPEAAATSTGVGFKEKDLVENYLHEQVCQDLMPLPRAQEAIARDWVAVYRGIPQNELMRLKAAYSSWADKN
jgi:hypothetical protein